MTENFNLSEKIRILDGYVVPAILVEDVKEFIKQDMELIKELFTNKITYEQFMRFRNKLAGDKLI